MAGKDMAKRKAVRALEAKRDKLQELARSTKVRLAETRAALKSTKARR